MAVAMETLETNKPEDVPNVEVPEMEVEKEEVEEMKEAKEVEEEKEGDGSRSSGKRRRGTVTPVDRPNRERKTVERYTEWVSSRSATKQVSIEQGPGTQLKDIPNVAFNLSKRKLDQTLKSLHTVLFGKHAKFNVLKQNIGLFSGYVWADDEQEKQREKVKEKLDKYVKEKLSDFCDFLNIQNHKSLKKEEVVLKLLEFLESPCVTTKVLLAEKEQKSKKRKAKSRKNKTPSKKQSGEKKKRLLSTKEDESSQSENDSQEDDNKVSDEEEEEYQPKKQLKSEKSSKSVKKNTKKEEQSVEKDSTKSPSKDQDNEKINKNKKEEPTTEELHAVVVKMLKEVDFDNVTVSDILNQLATHFGMDLTQRKAEAKAIITEAINDMADGEDEDDDNDS